MKISCPSCTAKYSIADEKVKSRLAKIRCRKCGTTIVIDGKVDPPTVQAADGPAAGADRSYAPATSAAVTGGEAESGVSEYTVDIADDDQRAMTLQQIVDAYNDGTITAETYVWKDGMSDWEPLADVPEINDALHQAAAQAQPAVAAAPSPAEYGSSPGAAAGFGFGRSPLGEPARAAARTSGGADLFGAIDTAGAETDITTSAPDTAPAATGARNESSVLFSLSALTAGASSPAPAGPSQSSDDSGLIDLAALTAATGVGASKGSDSASAALDLGSAPLAPTPLGSPLAGAPLTGGTTAPLGIEAQAAQASNKSAMFIGGGIAFAGLLGALVFFLKDDPPPAAMPAPVATVVKTVVAPAPAAPTDAPAVAAKAEKDDSEEAAQPDEEDEDEADEQATTKKAAAASRPAPRPRPAPKAAPRPAPKAASPKPAPKPAAKPAPKKKSCNCAPNDLMCAMKCSAGG